MKRIMLLVAMVTMAMVIGCGHTNMPNDDYVAVEPIIPVVSIEEVAEVADTKVKIKEAIMFELDSAIVEFHQMSIISKVADLMNEYPDTVLFLDGYASKEGPVEHNLALSQARANSVKEALVNQGVDVTRIFVSDGQGATDEFGDVLSKNRRVMILSLSNFTELQKY